MKRKSFLFALFLVVILCRFFRAEWVRASTSSRRVFAEYFKPMHTDKFASSQESRNQKIFYFVLSQINIHHNSRLSFKNICIRTLSPDRLSLRLLSSHPIQEKTRSAWVLVAGTQRYLRASLTRVGYSSILILPHPRGSPSLLRVGSFLYLQLRNHH